MSEGVTCYERDEELCADEMCLRTGCRLQKDRLALLEMKRAADEYERRIKTKIYDSNLLTAGEWVYLVGVFQAANDHEECAAPQVKHD